MTYNPDIHKRMSIRLKEYDYSQNGAYFITICTHGKKCLFGDIVGAGSKPALFLNPATATANGQKQDKQNRAGLEPAPTEHINTISINAMMNLNEMGQLVQNTWSDLVNHINGIELDEFVVMPNHVHGIIVISSADGQNLAGLEPHPTGGKHGLNEIVRQFKTFSARRINNLRKTPGVPLWQRNYYEHIIRNENDYLRIAEYIVNNPLKWESDEDNPSSNRE